MTTKRALDSIVLKASQRQLEGFEFREKKQAPFYFVQAADPQLGLIVNYGDGTIADQYPNVTWDKEIELCRQAVKALNALEPRPAFVVICGDLLDALPDQWPAIRERQLADFLDVFSELDISIPLVCVSGNHDVGNTPTVDTLKEYENVFGEDYFDFWFNDTHFIVLNSQYFEDPSKLPEEARRQEAWLDALLSDEVAKSRCRHRVVFQHIPWFVSEADESKNYFNIEPQFRLSMLKKFKEAQVSHVFCGHVHRNAGGSFEGLECVISSAIGCQIGKDTHGMRIVKVLQDRIEHAYHPLDKFPTKVDLE